MSELTIEDLPNEVVIKILRLLEQEDSRNATLTCKLWNDLIESSYLWSLELYHNNEVDVNEPWVDFMLTTNRKFGTIKLNMVLDIPRNNTLEIFQKHGFHVVELHLIGSCIDSFVKFAEVLKCMPNLKHVSIFETSTLCGVSDTPPEQDLPDLNKLKSLEIIGSEYSVIGCFRKAKLTTIKVLNSYHEHAMDCKPLEEFLKDQNKLRTLAFRSIHHETSTIFRTENLNVPMPFHLTRLSLLNIRLQESPNDYNNLLKFLKPQAKTLKELEMGRHFPSFVYEFIFANMIKLHTFSMMMTEIPQETEFFERLEENRSVQNLIFSDSAIVNNATFQFLFDFVKKLPNVCSLNVQDYCGNETFLFMAGCLSKLKSLATYCFNGQIFQDVPFPNLEVLQIKRLDERIDWNEFTKINSRLNEITIEAMDDEAFLNTEDIEKITTNVNLETLRIGEHFTADKRFFEVVRKNCPNLKVLDLHRSCIPDEHLLDYKEYTDWNLLRLCENDAFKRSNAITLWNTDNSRFMPDDDEDDWDRGGDVMDPFDIHLLDINHYDFENEYGDYDGDYDGYDYWNDDHWDDGYDVDRED